MGLVTDVNKVVGKDGTSMNEFIVDMAGSCVLISSKMETIQDII